MIKLVMTVQGMMCPHCEARVSKAVREVMEAQQVTPSHKKGTLEIICADGLDPEIPKAAVEAAGYPVTGMSVKKKGFLGLWV